MKRKFVHSLATLLVALTAAGGLAFAQGAEEPESTEVEEQALSVVDRWLEAPDTVFDASEVELDDLQFIARPLVVFANSPADPSFTQQMELILDRVDGLVERDVIIIVDTDPDAQSEPRQTLRPRGFALVLIDKNGRVAQRKPSPFDVRELERSIDKMPLRQQEIRERTD